MNLVPFALGLLVVGWIGLHVRKSMLGGAISILVLWQGTLALAAISVFQKSESSEGAVLLWFFISGSLLSVGSILVLGLRRYYLDRDVNWHRNEEIKH